MSSQSQQRSLLNHLFICKFIATAIPWSLYGERRDLFEAHLLPLYVFSFIRHLQCNTTFNTTNIDQFFLLNFFGDFPSYPRLDITWSRLHRSHHHYYRRLHRHRNRLENFRLLKDSPSMPVDYQDYQYRSAAGDGNAGVVAATPNFVSEETTHQRNHRKRHLQHKQNHDSGAASSHINEDEPQYQRQRRSLNRIDRNSSSRRRLVGTVRSISS